MDHLNPSQRTPQAQIKIECSNDRASKKPSNDEKERQEPQGQECIEAPKTPSVNARGLSYPYSSSGTPLSSKTPYDRVSKYSNSAKHIQNVSALNSHQEGTAMNSRIPVSAGNLQPFSTSIGGISSLLPDHFSQLSQSSQQAILEKILATHSTAQTSSRASTSQMHQQVSAQQKVAAQDACSTEQLSSRNIGERSAGVGAASDVPSIAMSAAVVSLPNHSSSLNMPDSPGPSTKNESNASMCSSNNTLVIHGSNSPDSPYDNNKWSSLLQQQTRASSITNSEKVSYAPVPINTSLPSSSGGDFITEAGRASFLQTSTASSHQQSAPPYNQSTQSTVTSSALSPTERVLHYISGKSTDLSDIPASIIDQSGILKHLLLTKANPSLELPSSSNIQLRSSMSVGAADHQGNFPRTRSIVDSHLTAPNTNSIFSTSKLTSKSSSSGSVYSNPLDNLTSTSGYSSSSASTPYALRSTFNTTAGDYNMNLSRIGDNDSQSKYDIANIGSIFDRNDLPPPPAYPHLTSGRADAKDESNNKIDAFSSSVRDVNRGRGMTSRDTRRDLSLGPELRRYDNQRNVDASVKSKDSFNAHGNSLDKSPLSQSQPDLSKLNEIHSKEKQETLKDLPLSQRFSADELPGVIDLLYNENIALRLELEICNRKVSKLQKFETEIHKVSAALESLVKMCSRREQLEKLARTKLQSQVQSLTRANIDLKEELDAIKSTAEGTADCVTSRKADESSFRNELSKRDAIIAQLVAQNKELLAGKERLEMEVAAQKQTLLGQRKHIDVLDSALVSSQQNVSKLEGELRLKRGAADDAHPQSVTDSSRLQREMLLLRFKQYFGNADASDLSNEALELELHRWEQQQNLQRLQQVQQRSQFLATQQHLAASRQAMNRSTSSQHLQQQHLSATPRQDEDLGALRLYDAAAAGASISSSSLLQPLSKDPSHWMMPQSSFMFYKPTDSSLNLKLSERREMSSYPTASMLPHRSVSDVILQVTEGDSSTDTVLSSVPALCLPSSATLSSTALSVTSTASGTEKSRSGSMSSEEVLQQKDQSNDGEERGEDSTSEAVSSNLPIISSSSSQLGNSSHLFNPPSNSTSSPSWRVDSMSSVNDTHRSSYHPSSINDKESQIYINHKDIYSPHCPEYYQTDVPYSYEPPSIRKDHSQKYQSNEPDYVNFRPLWFRSDTQRDLDSSDYHDPELERTNYSKYLTKQFEKLRDVTLSNKSNIKRLSYPLKNATVNTFNQELDDSSKTAFESSSQDYYSMMKYPHRPHSLVEFKNPRTFSDITSLNYSNPEAQMLNERYAEHGMNYESQLLPDYMEPPDYALHKHQTLECIEGRHESSVPPVILRDNTNMPQKRPHGVCEHQRSEHSSISGIYDLHKSSPNNNNRGSKRFSLPPNPHSTPPQVRLSPQLNSAPPLPQRYSATPSPRVSREFTDEYHRDTSTPRGDPPPYHSHHEILDTSPVVFKSEQSALSLTQNNGALSNVQSIRNTVLPDVTVSSSTTRINESSKVSLQPPFELCKKNHSPNTTCKSCSSNSSRSTYRKNAASLVRRASSGASLLKRKSAKLRSSFHTEVDLEETPSILARLRKEWQDRKGTSKSTDNISAPNSKTADSSDSSSFSTLHSKSSESLGYNLPNLSQEQWTITENQAVGHTRRQFSPSPLSYHSSRSSHTPLSSSPSMKRTDTSNQIGNERLSNKSTNVQMENINSRNALNSADVNELPSQRYCEVDISDDDSTYDTLIIKDLSDISETHFTDDCSCSENCSHNDGAMPSTP